LDGTRLFPNRLLFSGRADRAVRQIDRLRFVVQQRGRPELLAWLDGLLEARRQLVRLLEAVLRRVHLSRVGELLLLLLLLWLLPLVVVVIEEARVLVEVRLWRQKSLILVVAFGVWFNRDVVGLVFPKFRTRIIMATLRYIRAHCTISRPHITATAWANYLRKRPVVDRVVQMGCELTNRQTVPLIK
jgi:hypothetical protein